LPGGSGPCKYLDIHIYIREADVSKVVRMHQSRPACTTSAIVSTMSSSCASIVRNDAAGE
jgi:hypothetical protein